MRLMFRIIMFFLCFFFRFTLITQIFIYVFEYIVHKTLWRLFRGDCYYVYMFMLYVYFLFVLLSLTD